MIAIKHRVLKLLIATTVIQSLTLQNATAEACTKPPVAKGTWVSCVASGVAIAQKNGKYGLVDRRGKTVADYQYDYIGKFQDGLAIATKEGKWGLVDPTGKHKIPLEYDDVWAFEDGFARVYKDGKMGVINKSNELVVPMVYEIIGSFNSGLAIVIKNDKFGYINQYNKAITPLIFDRGSKFDNGFAFVKKSEKWGVIDTQGTLVVPYIYDDIESISSEKTSAFIIEKDGMYGLMDRQRKVILPAKYEWFHFDYDAELTSIKNDDGKGAINRQGVVVEPIYDRIYIRDNMIIAKLDDKYGIFDSKGKLLFPFEYDEYGYLKKGLGYLKQDEKVGLINNKGKQLTPIIFDELSVIRGMEDSYIEAKVGDKYGFVDDQGKTVIEVKYERWKAYQLKDARQNNDKNNK